MKKIVGILAVAAVLATSVFAADVSAKAKLDGSLFKYAADGAISAIQIQHNVESWNPNMAFAVNGDKAGASFSYYVAEGSGNAYKTTNQGYSIWFSPLDGLKITAGHWSTNLNQETIDWCNTETGVESDGYAVSYGANGFSADLFLVAMDTPFFSKAKDADAAVRELYAKVQYGADFGTINAMFDKNGKKMVMGAGYSNTFGSVKMFTNVLAALNDGFGKVRGELFVSTAIDSIGISSFIAGEYNGEKAFGLSGWRIGDQGSANKASVGMSLKVTFPLGNMGGYVYFKDGNFLADSFSCTIKPGVTGSVGAMGYEVAIDVTVADKVSVNVPVSMTVNF